MELWYTIIREMTDKDLLRVSAVCSTFNAFTISEYLARHDISTAAKEITGPAYIIHPLQLSCIPPPVEHLVRHFRPYDIRRDLLSLQRFVPRAQSLRDLGLSFAGSLLHAHRNDRIPVEYSARELMGIFCRVLSGMASKAAGPIVVVGQFAMFVCCAEEIAGWRLDALQFNALSERNTLMAKIRGIAGGPSTTSERHGFGQTRGITGEGAAGAGAVGDFVNTVNTATRGVTLPVILRYLTRSPQKGLLGDLNPRAAGFKSDSRQEHLQLS
ncbi:hypothetical protein C8F04DRAFT_1278391 [Mycena alexandri]|uniref:F-box domain-containing protein n=1 Tax=Mycena alexandri TaxID=1745969 RepID=A0AAD6RYV9_9AGAR|nr:hypothetical protein C8F04DRAFT_1278391 [Mycena alexandri]